MTIRFTCSECASVLKIKDELAGTPARCPKCKTKFVVPNPSPEEEPPLDEAEKPQNSETAPESNDHEALTQCFDLVECVSTRVRSGNRPIANETLGFLVATAGTICHRFTLRFAS